MGFGVGAGERARSKCRNVHRLLRRVEVSAKWGGGWTDVNSHRHPATHARGGKEQSKRKSEEGV